jgi:hypothetical protein
MAGKRCCATLPLFVSMKRKLRIDTRKQYYRLLEVNIRRPQTVTISLAFCADLPYMRASLAFLPGISWPPLDDIPAVGDPFPPN